MADQRIKDTVSDQERAKDLVAACHKRYSEIRAFRDFDTDFVPMLEAAIVSLCADVRREAESAERERIDDEMRQCMQVIWSEADNIKTAGSHTEVAHSPAAIDRAIVRADKCLRGIRAQGDVAVMGWQSIETAKKDGKPMLLWWRGCLTPAVGRWTANDDGEGWRCDGDQCIPINQVDCTHWQPLPAPEARP